MVYMNLPKPFIAVDERTPPDDTPVLVVRHSGYTSCEYEVLTAKYMPDYRPHNPWQTLHNDAVTDSGNEVIGWCKMKEWLFSREGN